MTRWIALLFATMLIATPGCLTSDSAATQEPSEPPGKDPPAPPAPWIDATLTDLVWDSENLSGPASLSLSFEMSSPATCEGVSSLTGTTGGARGAFMMDAFWMPGTVGGGGTYGWWTAGQPAHAHLGTFVDTRIQTANDEDVYNSYTDFSIGPVEGLVQVTMALRNATRFEEDAESAATGGLYFEMHCGAAFRVTQLRAGREVRLFDLMNVEGGAGAAADAATPVAFAGASANALDQVAAAFTSPHVLLESLSSGGVGAERLHHPNGDSAFPTIPFGGLDRHRFEGAAGAYTLEVDRVAANGAYVGVLAGQYDVSHPNEIHDLPLILEAHE